MILEDLKVILEQSAYKLKHVEDILEHIILLEQINLY